MKLRSELTVKSWEEAPDDGRAGLNRVSAIFELKGPLHGQLQVDYLMYYQKMGEEDQHNSQATYTGFLVFTGRLSNKEGSFVLSDNGVYSPKGPQSSLTILPDSATLDLAGLKGQGRYFSEGETMVLELEAHL